MRKIFSEILGCLYILVLFSWLMWAGTVIVPEVQFLSRRAYAGMSTLFFRGTGGAETYFCTSCPDGAKGGDIACETFDSVDYDCTSPGWTESLGGGTIDNDNTPTGSWPCTDENTYNVRIAVSTTTQTSLDHGSEFTPYYGIVYLKIISESLISGQNSEILNVNDGSNNTMGVQLAQDATGVYIRVWLRNDADQQSKQSVPMANSFCTEPGEPNACCTGAGEGSCGTTIDYVTVGTDVIRVRFAVDNTATSGTGVIYAKVGSNSERTMQFTENGTGDNDGLRYFRLGSPADQVNFTAEYDFVRIDDDTIPAICTGDS